MKYKKVLLIDDSEIDNFINKKLIDKSEFAKEVIEKTSAKDALDYLKAEKEEELPEVILLDIMMPLMDGFGFLDEFEKLPEKIRQNSRIVMLSSSESFKDLNRANANRLVHKFLNKPLTEKSLQAINV